MMFFWFPLLFLIPFALFWMMRTGTGMGMGMGCCGEGHTTHGQTPRPGGLDPIEIARERLARGEITPTEFDEIRRVIG